MQVPEQSFWFLLLMECNSELGQGLLPAPRVTLAGCVICGAPAAQCWAMHAGWAAGTQGHREVVAGWGAQRASCFQEPSSLTAPACLYAPRSTGVKAGREPKAQAQKRGHSGLFSLVCPRRAWAPMARWAHARALSEPRESTDLGHGTHWGKSISGSHN